MERLWLIKTWFLLNISFVFKKILVVCLGGGWVGVGADIIREVETSSRLCRLQLSADQTDLF